MRTIHMLFLAGVAAVAMAAMTVPAAAQTCCSVPANVKKSAACSKCGDKGCTCVKPAGTNTCTAASAKAADAK